MEPSFGRLRNHENHLSAVKRNGATIESYLYDDGGIRIKKTAGGVDTYYVNSFYEVSGGAVTKYYYFGGQRIAMRKNGTVTYLHSDHLGSTVLETNTSGYPTANQKYYAYGTQRDTGPVTTDHKFTGQKLDGTGLMYYASRYYDPAIGAFVSPDALVPDATNVFSYNRFMYTAGNPLNRVDPTGHVDVGIYLDPGTNCWHWCGTATMNPRPHPMAGSPDPTGAADAANAVIYATEGEYVNTLLSAAALIPLGDALKAGKYADEAVEIVGKNIELVDGMSMVVDDALHAALKKCVFRFGLIGIFFVLFE